MRRPKTGVAAPRLPIGRIPVTGLQPPLKWAGGKRWLVPILRTRLLGVPMQRLVEPFVGGLAVTLGLEPPTALLSDSNPHLINFYRWVQRGLDVRSSGVRYHNDRSVFFANRERFNQLVEDDRADTQEAAALFYYLNRTAFNGLCRFNRRGLFNVPFGRYATIGYRSNFSEYACALSPYEFRHGDFAGIECVAGDLIYADPPYDVEFTTYSSGGFYWEDQLRLAEWLAAQTVPVIASNQATERILDLYGSLGFEVTTVDAPRRISCDGNREGALEMLATKGL